MLQFLEFGSVPSGVFKLKRIYPCFLDMDDEEDDEDGVKDEDSDVAAERKLIYDMDMTTGPLQYTLITK